MDNKFDITSENENKLSINEAKFILEQAEKSLKEIGDQSQVIVQRTTTLTTLIAGVLITIIAFSVQRLETEKSIDVIFIVSIIAIIYLLYLCFGLVKNIKGRDYYPIGSEPQTLLIDKFFEAPNDKIREVWFYITEIRRYQEKIDFNKYTNENRWEKFNKHLWQVAATPAILVFLYIITTLLFTFFGNPLYHLF